MAGKRQDVFLNAPVGMTLGAKTSQLGQTIFLSIVFTIGALAPTELYYVTGLFGLLACAVFSPGLFISAFSKASLLWLIVLVSFLSSLFAMGELNYSISDLPKGFYQLSRPAIFLMMGYILFRVLESRNALLNAICICGLFSAVVYIVRYLSDPSISAAISSGDRTYIRDVLGAGSYTWSIAIVVLVAFPRLFGKRYFVPKGVAVCIIAAAIILSTGRTALVWIGLLGVLMAAPLPSRPTALQTGYAAIFLLMFFSFTPFLQLGMHLVSEDWYINLPIPAESMPINRSNLAYINSGWRGFETFKSYDYVISLEGLWFFFGTGLGSTVPIGLSFELGGEFFSRIPTFHNGFSLLFVRSGLLGLIIFCAANLRLLSDLKRKAAGGIADRNLARLGVGMIFLTLVSLPTIAGLYHAREGGTTMPLIVGYISAYLRSSWFVEDRRVYFNSPEQD